MGVGARTARRIARLRRDFGLAPPAMWLLLASAAPRP
jgi:hypothetical protein